MMTPAGGVHGIVASAIHAALSSYIDANDLGFRFADNTGFLLPGLGDTVPDAWLTDADMLDGGDIVPGFSIPVAKLFARVAR